MIFRSAVLIAALLGAGSVAAQSLEASVLPGARSVANTNPATLLMTVSNSGTTDATRCSVRASVRSGAAPNLSWAILQNGMPSGMPDASFSVPAGGRTDLVLAATGADANFFAGFRAVCDAGVESRIYPGVNTAALRFATGHTDIIPIIATPSNDGIIRFNSQSRSAAFSIAAVNIGIEGPVRVSGDRVGFSAAGQVRTLVCETGTDGVCLAPRSSSIDVTLGTTPRFFSFILQLADGHSAPFIPQALRYEVRLEDQTNSGVAATTAALFLEQPAWSPANDRPLGLYEIQARNIDDPGMATLSYGEMSVVSERMAGFVEQGPPGFTIDQAIVYSPGDYARAGSDCGPTGSALPNGCLLVYTGELNAFDIRPGGNPSWSVRCHFDNDGGGLCMNVAAREAGNLSSSATTDMEADYEHFTVRIPFLHLENTSAIRNIRLNGITTDRKSRETGVSEGFNVGDLVPHSTDLGAWTAPVDFVLDGCRFEGTVELREADIQFVAESGVMVSVEFTLVECEADANSSGLWEVNELYKMAGWFGQAADGDSRISSGMMMHGIDGRGIGVAILSGSVLSD